MYNYTRVTSCIQLLKCGLVFLSKMKKKKKKRKCWLVNHVQCTLQGHILPSYKLQLSL